MSIEPGTVSKRIRAEVRIEIPIAKRDEAKRVVTGVVLEPDTVDAHNEWERPETIERAAWDFLAKYNAETRLGVQHKVFGLKLELVESYIAPVDFELGGELIRAGSWVMTVRVLDDDVWQAVLDGGITGFSIGGIATVAATDVA